MFQANTRRKLILVLAASIAFPVTLILVERGGPTHPEFGKICHTHSDEVPKGLEKITRGLLHSWFNDMAGVMRLGSTPLFWNMAGNKTGYVSFENRVSKGWEFAPCKFQRLVDVTRTDLDCEFCPEQHPEGKLLFGDSWLTNSLKVAEGQILFARSLADTSVVYVLRFARQESDGTSSSIYVEYVTVKKR